MEVIIFIFLIIFNNDLSNVEVSTHTATLLAKIIDSKSGNLPDGWDSYTKLIIREFQYSSWNSCYLEINIKDFIAISNLSSLVNYPVFQAYVGNNIIRISINSSTGEYNLYTAKSSSSNYAYYEIFGIK